MAHYLRKEVVHEGGVSIKKKGDRGRP